MHSGRTHVVLAALAAVVPALLAAQEPPGPIQDNSFLLEEAYNQETRVVQHISFFNRAEDGSWRYAFTQEWPVRGQRHQLSWTLLVQKLGSPSDVGLGDFAVNYRYQAVFTERTAVSPRLSVLLPTGNADRGFGAGSAGIQVNLPVSWMPSRSFVTHWNAGATHVPSARGLAGNSAATTGLNLGQSTIWLATPLLNVMLETVWSRDEVVTGPDQTASAETFLVSPGLRYAINRGNLQIVPGVAVPIGVGPSRGTTSLIVYLSFEHGY